jgi:transposase
LISLAPDTKAFLACRSIDLRNGFEGLAAKAMIDAEPSSGHLFVFRGKRGDYFKGLYWDGTGLCLFAKRLEQGKFVWSPIIDGSMTLTPAQLALLIEAMDWRRTVAPPTQHNQCCSEKAAISLQP